MKIHSKIAIVALSLNLLVPTATLARDGVESTSSPSPEVHSSDSTNTESKNTEKPSSLQERGQKFCSNGSEVRTKLTAEVEKKSEGLKENFDKRSENLLSKRAELVKKISDNRLKSDVERTNRFAELEAKAKTDAQKAAVKAYEASVLAAIAKHRAAVDAADKIFLDGVIAAVGTRQTDLMTATTAYKAAVAAAIAKAKSSCTAGVDAKTVRQTLAVSLKTAQSNFATARKAADKVHPDLNPLKTAHKAAIKQANADFRASLKTALTALKAALKPAGTTDSADPSESPAPSESSSPSVSPKV